MGDALPLFLLPAAELLPSTPGFIARDLKLAQNFLFSTHTLITGLVYGTIGGLIRGGNNARATGLFAGKLDVDISFVAHGLFGGGLGVVVPPLVLAFRGGALALQLDEGVEEVRTTGR